MDGSQFDRLTRAFGSGTSRRAIVKAALGLSGAAVAGSQLTLGTSAARRPTPTPKPPSCPGQQYWDGSKCVCPGNTSQCGPDCCPAGAECCDNACCYGECFGEERCCPTGSFVCNGECLPFFEGACCSDSDCGEGELCASGVCQSICAEDGASCSSNTDCCSGICQAGICYATYGGNCPGEANYCAGQNAYFCNGTITCYCVLDGNGDSICMDYFDCYDSCEQCPEGSICNFGSGCCGSEYATCIVPCPPDGGGCFTGETRIAMADGTSTPVSEIRVGDHVLGDDGAVNRVVNIDMPLLGNRELYGFDGGIPFVTGSHPFQTDDGWKAILPADAYRDHRLPGVQQLRIGDRLVLLSGVLVPVRGGVGSTVDSQTIRTEPFAFASITPHTADPSTQLYNLQLDGNHTYFANDLLVHNK